MGTFRPDATRINGACSRAPSRSAGYLEGRCGRASTCKATHVLTRSEGELSGDRGGRGRGRPRPGREEDVVLDITYPSIAADDVSEGRLPQPGDVLRCECRVIL